MIENFQYYYNRIITDARNEKYAMSTMWDEKKMEMMKRAAFPIV